MKRILAAAAATSLLSACVGEIQGIDSVSRIDVRALYYPGDVSVFAGGGGVTSIRGTTRDGASAEEIASKLRLPAWFHPRTITAAPAGEELDGPHLVLVFAPQGGIPARKACRGEAEGGTAGPQLMVVAVFCSSYDTPRSYAVLTTDGSPVPSDPDFGHRFVHLMNEVMPSSNPDWGPGNGCRGSC